jgi:type IV secretion system protein VirB4
LLYTESECLGEVTFRAFETEELTGSAAGPAVFSCPFHRIDDPRQIAA